MAAITKPELCRLKFVLYMKIKHVTIVYFILIVLRPYKETGKQHTGQLQVVVPHPSPVTTLTSSFPCVQVTCLACDHRSNTVEPFWDLSLEFPERYHSNSRESAAQASCHLTEMLAKFTETEALEGNIYACDHCNCELNNVNTHTQTLSFTRDLTLILTR